MMMLMMTEMMKQAAMSAAAREPAVVVYLPTALISSIATLVLYKALPALLLVMRGKRGNGKVAEAGSGELCGVHSRDIARLQAAQENTERALVRIEGKVDALPFRVIEMIQRGEK